MPTSTLLAVLVALVLMPMAVGAQAGRDPNAGQRPAKETDRPDAESGNRQAEPSQTQTGGDRRRSVADPAQAHESGANVGEGASYSRSSEKPDPPSPQPR